MPLEQERTKTTMTRRASSTKPAATPAPKPAEKRAGAPRKTAPQVDAPAAPRAVDPLERRRLIEEAAYFRAERRGFTAGAEEQDWLEAEAEVDARLGASAASDAPPKPRAPRRGGRSAPGKASS